MDKLPKYQDLITPMLRSLDLDGTEVSISEIEKKVISILGIPETLSREIHSGNRTELQYRLAWARTKAKASGWISTSKREFWGLTESGKVQISME